MAWADGPRKVNEGVSVSHALMNPFKLEHCGFDEGALPPPGEPPPRHCSISCMVGRLQQCGAQEPAGG